MIEVSAKLYIGDVVEMRKPHPCGGRVWEIVRVGADVGLACKTCGRRVLLSRRDFARGVKRFVQRVGPAEGAEQEPTGSQGSGPSRDGTPAGSDAVQPGQAKRKSTKRDAKEQEL
jgi:hypothetical protein